MAPTPCAEDEYMFEIQSVQTAPVLAGGYVEDMVGIKELDHLPERVDARARPPLKRPGSAQRKASIGWRKCRPVDL